MNSKMLKCACYHPVLVQYPKGSNPPAVTACEHCKPLPKEAYPMR